MSETFETYGANIKAIVAVLKARFGNLTAEELIDLAVKILSVISDRR